MGTDVLRHCKAAGDDVYGLTHADLDITDTAVVANLINTLRPDTIINCAAWTNVDACESDPVRADRINHLAVAGLAEASAAIGAHLVQVSTDYVFDGSKTTAYDETDAPNPQSVYGQTKLAGERAAGAAATIVRTSWVYSRHGGNMVATILRLAAQHDELSFVDDQRGNPTYTADLARPLRDLAAARQPGIVHVTNTETVSWYEFARAVLESTGADPQRVRAITTAELDPPRPATRPANSALSNARLAALGHEPLPSFRKHLADVAQAYC